MVKEMIKYKRVTRTYVMLLDYRIHYRIIKWCPFYVVSVIFNGMKLLVDLPDSCGVKAFTSLQKQLPEDSNRGLLY